MCLLFCSLCPLDLNRVVIMIRDVFRVFRDEKHTPFNTAPFPRPYGPELESLLEHIEIIESL